MEREDKQLEELDKGKDEGTVDGHFLLLEENEQHSKNSIFSSDSNFSKVPSSLSMLFRLLLSLVALRSMIGVRVGLCL